MSAKSLKVFGPPTTKWWLCKIFAKLNGNHLLMTNIFKLQEYQTFGLMKIRNICKIWFANKIFSLLRWIQNYFSWFFKRFQLLEIILRHKIIMKNNFYFILTNWIFYWQIRFCTYYEFLLNQMLIFLKFENIGH